MIPKILILICVSVFAVSCGPIKTIPTPIGPIEFHRPQGGNEKATSVPKGDMSASRQSGHGESPSTPSPNEESWTDITIEVPKWTISGESIMGNDKYITIKNNTGRGDTVITTKQFSKKGTYKLVAMIKAANVASQGSKNYEKGKFQAVILKDGVETDWPDNDFDGTFDWQKRSVMAKIMNESESLFFRIGLQHASGTVHVGDIHILWKP